MSRLLRVSAIATTGGIMVVALILSAISPAGLDPFTAIVGLAFLAVATLLVLRVPENRVSWLLLWISFGFGVAAYSFLGSELALAINLAGLFAILLPSVGVLLPVWFPTGRPPTPAWNWVAWAGIASSAIFALSVVIGVLVGDFNDDVDGCYTFSACLELGSLGLTLIASVAAVASLVTRWARSQGVERQQLKLMAAVFVLFAIATAFEFGGGQGHPLVEAAFTITTLLIPATLAVTISRYRLYDIDRILSRTVSYAIVVTVLGLVFALGVVGIPNWVPGLDDSPLLVATATLTVAALFNPVRKRVQKWVDRRFNRTRYDAEQVMDVFAGSLRNRVEADDLLGGWVEVVGQTMQPAAIGVWVRPDREVS